MADKAIEIECSACGQESLLKRVPQYEGFKRVGDTLTCASCGHVFASEAEVPFKSGRKPAVFTEADRPKAVRVFDEHEKDRICRYCKNYVVNPFTQRCSLHHRTVEATDTCPQFERAEQPKE